MLAKEMAVGLRGASSAGIVVISAGFAAISAGFVAVSVSKPSSSSHPPGTEGRWNLGSDLSTRLGVAGCTAMTGTSASEARRSTGAVNVFGSGSIADWAS
jgi:hypothetical protein